MLSTSALDSELEVIGEAEAEVSLALSNLVKVAVAAVSVPKGEGEEEEEEEEEDEIGAIVAAVLMIRVSSETAGNLASAESVVIVSMVGVEDMEDSVFTVVGVAAFVSVAAALLSVKTST